MNKIFITWMLKVIYLLEKPQLVFSSSTSSGDKRVEIDSSFHQLPSFVQSQLLPSGVCIKEIERTFYNHTKTRKKDHRANIMQTAICFHSHDRIMEALKSYNYLREMFPDFAFPLVNIALIELKNDHPSKVIQTLSLYFKEVGGMFGNETEIPIDYDSQVVGSPCQPHAVHRLECVNALNFYGIALVELYKYDKALICYQRAIEIGFDIHLISDVYQNLGSLYHIMGYDDDAADSFLKSLWSSVEMKGDIDPIPLIQRAMLIPSISSSLDDSILYKKRFEKRIYDLIKLIEYGGAGWIEDKGDLFKIQEGISNINKIKAIRPLQGTINFFEKRIQSPPFYLHYYGYHDRPLQELVMTMYEKIRDPSSIYVTVRDSYRFPNIVSTLTAPFVPYLSRKNVIHQHGKNRSKLRIVFISSHFGGNEPHGLLLLDVIRRLPSSLFECLAIGIGKKEPSKMFIEAVNGKYYGVGTNDHRAREILTELTPDCLVFREVMNDGLLFFLAQTRFAPTQILVMGAPVTSGLSTIDYFISGDRLEHPFRTQMSGDFSHREHYSEQLVLLDGQSISFPYHEPHPFQSSALAQGDATESLSAFYNDSTTQQYQNITGIPITNGQIYLCYQNLFKIHPRFDNILITILQYDPEGHIVLQAARAQSKTKEVVHRIQKTVISKICFNANHLCHEAQRILSRIHFIPRVQSQHLKNVYEQVNVVLHPFPFGGSKTASDALKFGIPLVTWPQSYLRGRLAPTFYTSMGLHEIDKEVAEYVCCVATDILDYIAKVLKLGRDKAYHQKVSSAILKRNHRIFDDIQTSYEWARFITRSLGVVLHGNQLAKKMNYAPQVWQIDPFIQNEFIRSQQKWRFSKTIMMKL